MTRSRFGRRTGQPRSAEELQWLARGLAESGGRAEDVFWEQSLSAAVDKLLESGDEDAINASLDQLFKDNLPGYEALADILESRAESTTALGSSRKPAAADHDIVLIAAPILAWSRFAIPANHLPESLIANLRVHLGAHVLADGVKFAFADALFSPDQLPQGYCETALFTRELGSHAQSQQDLNIDADTLPETTRFLSDLRYILAAVSVKRGAPIFRWQEADGSREHAATQWAQQAGPCIAPMLAGCSIEMVLPEAFWP